MSRGRTERLTRFRLGHRSELIAAIALRLKGYRILDRRYRTPVGEVDLVAVRVGRLSFVEVKSRRTRQDAEASLTPRQRERVRRAASLWLARHPSYAALEIHFDLVFLHPWRWPRHLPDAL